MRLRTVAESSHLSANPDPPDVLLVDGFDLQGQPAQLSSQRFYDDCYHALGSDGLLVVNLCSRMEQKSISRIERSFDDRVLVVIPEDGENKIVFAVKGERLWMKQEPTGALVSKLRAGSRKLSLFRAAVPVADGWAFTKIVDEFKIQQGLSPLAVRRTGIRFL